MGWFRGRLRRGRTQCLVSLWAAERWLQWSFPGCAASRWGAELFWGLLFHLQTLCMVEISWGEIRVCLALSRVLPLVQHWITQLWSSVFHPPRQNEQNRQAWNVGTEADSDRQWLAPVFMLFGEVCAPCEEFLQLVETTARAVWACQNTQMSLGDVVQL